MVIKFQCPVCGRYVARMRQGKGALRRHMISRGVVCDGSWQYPGRLTLHQFNAAIAPPGDESSNSFDDGLCPKCGNDYFENETILPNGELGCKCALSRPTQL